MPRVVDNKMEKWNFYIDKIDKLKFMKSLLDGGHQKAQSAALRAFIKRYTVDEQLRKLMEPYIENEKVAINNNKISLL